MVSSVTQAGFHFILIEIDKFGASSSSGCVLGSVTDFSPFFCVSAVVFCGEGVWFLLTDVVGGLVE